MLTKKDTTTKQVQYGKAGEYLVCHDLIMRGYNAIIVDQGLPFDIIVEKDGKIKKIQVKSSSCVKNKTNQYTFCIREGKERNRIKNVEFDYLALAALDRKIIAYIPAYNAISNDNIVVGSISFKTKEMEYSNTKGNYIEDFRVFDWENVNTYDDIKKMIEFEKNKRNNRKKLF